MENSKLISMKMPKEMIDQLKKISSSNGLTLSAQVRVILSKYIKESIEGSFNG